jgi:hypothetical protein
VRSGRRQALECFAAVPGNIPRSPSMQSVSNELCLSRPMFLKGALR